MSGSSSWPSPLSAGLHAELIAVLIAVADGRPRLLTIADGAALPAGPIESGHRSLQQGLRAWVERLTRHNLGYVEQLYTFADLDRSMAGRSISISYLGLTRETPTMLGGSVAWQDLYLYFPWEDRRFEAGQGQIATALGAWASGDPEKWQRARFCFGLDGAAWDDEAALARYELLYEAGLVAEARSAGRTRFATPPETGRPMLHDHRRILATALARLRAKIKYRPVVFELMPESFTLLALQQTVEAIAGHPLHKQNFRRLIETQGLIEETGEMSKGTGRPAKLFRFRPDIRTERQLAGTRLPLTRS